MSRVIPTGVQNFSTLREQNYFYIDKTKFIKEWWLGGDRVTLITRPRRFGKTLMLDTVNTFFSPNFAGRSELFEGLEIWVDEKFRNLQGKVPVIFLSFARINDATYTEVISRIKAALASIYDTFTSLIDLNAISEAGKELFTSVRKSMSNDTAKDSLYYLCKFLTDQHKIKPIILLDEYDTPFQEAWRNGYWNELVNFMRGFFNATFKDNPFLERGLITGITRVAKESIFSDLNNLEVVSTTSNLYTDCFGFTEQEVFAAMDEYGLTNKEEVKSWYDGYIFGKDSEIYNPWSILGYLSKKTIDLYWANTSSNALVDKLIKLADVEVKEEFSQLLKGEAIVTNLDEEIVFPELYLKQGAIWSLLMASGYVKPLEFDRLTKTYKIQFTNQEVKVIMTRLISGWFNNSVVKGKLFCQALLTDNLESMNKNLKYITENIFSFFDTGGKEPERFYHAFVLGLIVDLKERYEITSNRESGYGRYDVMMIPRQPCDHAIVIEFKTLDTDIEKNLEQTCKNALKQIKDNKYISQLLDREIASSNIYVYGFAFQGKKVLITGGAYNALDWNNIFKTKMRKAVKKKK